MLRVLDLNQKQITISGQWDAALDQLAATLATGGLPQRNDIEGHLRDADGALNAVRAAGWRFFATGETDQKDKIAHNAAVSSASLNRARELVADKQLLERIDVLDPLVKEFVSVTNQVIEADLLKNSISKNRTIPIANEVAELLRTPVPIAQKAIAEAKAAVEDKMQRAGQVSLGFGAAIMLVLVGSNPGIAQIELGKHLGIDKASIVALLDRLEKAGLLDRQRSTRDRRRQGIFLTARGASELATLVTQVRALERQMSTRYTRPEFEQFLGFLQRLYS